MDRDDQWLRSNNKKLKHKNNRQFVTGRSVIIHNRKVMKMSIGLDVCELVGFKKNDRVNIFIHKENRNYLAIQKDFADAEGYMLSFGGHRNGNFLTFEFRYQTEESFRLSQTTILDYDFQEEHTLIVDLYRLKWRE